MIFWACPLLAIRQASAAQRIRLSMTPRSFRSLPNPYTLTIGLPLKKRHHSHPSCKRNLLNSYFFSSNCLIISSSVLVILSNKNLVSSAKSFFGYFLKNSSYTGFAACFFLMPSSRVNPFMNSA